MREEDRYLKVFFNRAYTSVLLDDSVSDAVVAAVFRSILQFTKDFPIDDAAVININSISPKDGYLILPEETHPVIERKALECSADSRQSYIDTCQAITHKKGNRDIREYTKQRQAIQDTTTQSQHQRQQEQNSTGTICAGERNKQKETYEETNTVDNDFLNEIGDGELPF